MATAYDPDGDVLRLTRAEESDGATGTLRTTRRGDITFTAGNEPGLVEVAYVVGDGRGGEQTGTLSITVVERQENQAPVARNDSETTFAGREVVIDVLDNDTDPNGDTLSLVRAVASEDAQVRWEPSSPEIRVTSAKAGTVNVVYRVTDGQATDEAVLRIDFQERGEKQPPVAVRDEVLLDPGEPAYVPVLDNDVDPDGEVLVVLGVSDLPDPSPDHGHGPPAQRAEDHRPHRPDRAGRAELPHQRRHRRGRRPGAGGASAHRAGEPSAGREPRRVHRASRRHRDVPGAEQRQRPRR